jgi:hypothetical protein
MTVVFTGSGFKAAAKRPADMTGAEQGDVRPIQRLVVEAPLQIGDNLRGCLPAAQLRPAAAALADFRTKRNVHKLDAVASQYRPSIADRQKLELATTATASDSACNTEIAQHQRRLADRLGAVDGRLAVLAHVAAGH